MAYQIVVYNDMYVGYFDDTKTDLEKFVSTVDSDMVPGINVKDCTTYTVTDNPALYKYDKDKKDVVKISVFDVPESNIGADPKADMQWLTKILLLTHFRNEMSYNQIKETDQVLRKLLEKYGGISQILSDLQKEGIKT